MVENNRAIAFTHAASPGRVLGIGNIAKRTTDNLSDYLPFGRSFEPIT
jgi:hypothetical protein